MDATTALQHLLQAALEEQRQHHDPAKLQRRPVITLAGDEGAQGLEVARILAERLGVPVYDKQLLNAVAGASGVDQRLLEKLDDRYQPHWTDWLFSFSSGLDVAHVQYYRSLVNCMLAVLTDGGIIIGRGGNIVLAHHRAFRVRVVGSVEQCAHRLANAEGIAYPQAYERVQKVNSEKGRFVWEYFRRRHNDPSLFDLVINTDHYADEAAVADVIQFAMMKSGRLA